MRTWLRPGASGGSGDRRAVLHGLAAGALILASLVLQAAVIASSDLGPAPSPAEVDAWKAEYRLAMATIGALLIAAAGFLSSFAYTLGRLVGGGSFATAGAVLLGAGGVPVALFGAFAVAGVVNPPELVVSNFTDAMVGAGLLAMGVVEWARRTTPRAVSGLGILLGCLLAAVAWTTAADPHAAQLGLLVWLIVRVLHLVRRQRTVRDAAPTPSRG